MSIELAVVIVAALDQKATIEAINFALLIKEFFRLVMEFCRQVSGKLEVLFQFSRQLRSSFLCYCSLVE